MQVPVNHPLLVLKSRLPWEELEVCLAEHWQKAGKNVTGGRGRPFDLSFYTRALVLMLVRKLGNVRELERELKENAVARLFVEVERPTESWVRDHSNLDRTWRALGAEGASALAEAVVKLAVELGFAYPAEVSGDTTCQEVAIGYPNEPGILRKVAERVVRLVKRVEKRGVEVGVEVIEAVKEVLRLVKEHHLFAKTPERKTEVLARALVATEEMMEAAKAVGRRARARGGAVLEKAAVRLEQLDSFVGRLMPQVLSWMETGKVAAGKLLHPGIEQARAVIRNKAGKRCEFGFVWLLTRLGDGYALGKMVIGAVSESQMPLLAVEASRRVAGYLRRIERVVYDRGGWSARTVAKLRKLGVEKIGIEPAGKAAWLVGELEQDLVRSVRGRTEGMIGTLKSQAYGFNNTRQRSKETVELRGQGAVASFNLNCLLRDLIAASAR
jgi:hypothetical protein